MNRPLSLPVSVLRRTSLALLLAVAAAGPLQAQGCEESALFVVTRGPGQATVWEVDRETDSLSPIVTTLAPLRDATYDPAQDLIYLTADGGALYRVARDGSDFETILLFGGPSVSDAPVFDAEGTLYFNTSSAFEGLWFYSPEPGGGFGQVLPQVTGELSVGLAFGTQGASAGALLGVESANDLLGPGVYMSSPPGAAAVPLFHDGSSSLFWDVKVRAGGSLLVSDRGGNRLLEFTGDGEPLGEFVSGVVAPSYLEVSTADDSVACLGAAGVFLFAADGTLLEQIALPLGEVGVGLALASFTDGEGTDPVPAREPSPPPTRPGEPGFCASGCEECAALRLRSPEAELTDLVPQSGEVLLSQTDFVLSRRGPDIVWRRTYRSQVQQPDSPMGPGWTHTYDEQLSACGNDLILRDGTGTITRFVLDPASQKYIADERFCEITRNPDGSFDMLLPDGGTMSYAKLDGSALSGKLFAVSDRHDNFILLNYLIATGALVELDHSDGTSVVFTSDASGRITAVAVAGVGSYIYSYSTAGDLVSVTTPSVTGTPNGNDFPAGKTTTYAYSGGTGVADLDHNLLSMTTPLSNTILRYEYAATTNPADADFDRLVGKVYGDAGDRIDLVYEAVAPTQANGLAVQRTIVNDRVGNVSELYHDADRRMVRWREFTGRAGADLPTTGSTNRPTGKLRASDPDFFETSWSWNEDAKVTEEVSAEGDSVQFVYERDLDPGISALAKGNVRELHRLPGPRGGDQAQIDEFFEYLDEFGGCCGSSFVTRHTDGRGNDTLHSYDAKANRIQTVHRDPGIVESWEYDTLGQVVRHVYPSHTGAGGPAPGAPREDVYTYYGVGDGHQNGLLRSITRDATGLALTRSWAYDERGLMIEEVDERGHDRRMVRNQLGQVVQTSSREVQDGSGLRYRTHMSYDADDRLVQTDVDNLDGDGAVDPLNPAWTTTFEHDVLGRVTRVEREVSQDGSGTVTLAEELEYDANRNLVLVRKGEAVNGSDPFNVIATSWDERDLVFQVTRGAGHPTDASSLQADYDGNGNPVRVTTGLEAGGRTTEQVLDGYERVQQVLDAMGNVSSLSYDASGNVVGELFEGELADGLGGAGNVRLSQVDMVYDVMDRLVREDEAHFDLASQAPIGDGARTRTYQWAAASLLLGEVDDHGHGTSYAYDGVHRLVEGEDAKANRVSWVYDASSNLVRSTRTERSDLGGPDVLIETVRSYDNLDRMILERDALGAESTYAYDSRSLLVRATDRRGNETRSSFDGLSRLLETSRRLTDTGDGSGTAAGAVTMTQTWDDSSRRVARTDGSGNSTDYGYDALDRLVAKAFADCTDEVRTYDAHDDLVLQRDANHSLVSRIHDGLGRPTRTDVVPGPGVSADTTFTDRVYDGAGRLVSALDDDSDLDRGYDSLSNLLEELDLAGATSNIYDAQGNRRRTDYPGGRSVQRAYDELDLLAAVGDLGGGVLASFQYGGPGYLLQRDHGNGTRLSKGYDGLRRPTSTEHVQDPGGAALVLDSRTYAWDAEGNKIGLQELVLGKDVAMTYDSLDRLVQSARSGRVKSYTLDGAGNRKRVDGGGHAGVYRMSDKTCKPGDLQMNQYTLIPGERRQYDRRGSLVSRKALKVGPIMNPGAPAAPPTVQMAYDYLGRLVEVLDGQSGERHVYAYDALGRRIRRTVDADGAGETTLYLYRGWQVIEEQDGAGATVATYVHGRGLDELISMRRDVDGDGVPEDYYYHADDQGSVVAVSDATGQVVERYAYTDYGRPTILDAAGTRRATSAIGNPLLYTGRRLDPETGLYYYRMRYMDPVAGRFVSRDPIGAFGDAANLGNAQAYVGNNPWSRVDPMGLEGDGQAEPGTLDNPAVIVMGLDRRMVLLDDLEAIHEPGLFVFASTTTVTNSTIRFGPSRHSSWIQITFAQEMLEEGAPSVVRHKVVYTNTDLFLTSPVSGGGGGTPGCLKGSVDLDFFEIPGVWKHNPIHSQPRGTTCPRCEPERREKPAAPPWGMPRVNSSPLPGYLWGERDRNSCGTFRRLHPPVYGPEPRPRRRGRRRGGITTVEPPDLEPGKYLYPPSEDDKDPFDYQAGECVS